MKNAYHKKYRIMDVPKTYEGVITINTPQGILAKCIAMDEGELIGKCSTNTEEYLFQEGLFKLNKTPKGRENMDVYSCTEKGLKRLVKKLNLPYP